VHSFIYPLLQVEEAARSRRSSPAPPSTPGTSRKQNLLRSLSGSLTSLVTAGDPRGKVSACNAHKGYGGKLCFPPRQTEFSPSPQDDWQLSPEELARLSHVTGLGERELLERKEEFALIAEGRPEKVREFITIHSSKANFPLTALAAAKKFLPSFIVTSRQPLSLLAQGR